MDIALVNGKLQFFNPHLTYDPGSHQGLLSLFSSLSLYNPFPPSTLCLFLHQFQISLGLSSATGYEIDL